MKKLFFVLVAAYMFAAAGAYAQQTPQKYIVETEYLLYMPEGYDADTTVRWPLVIFLHGAGETGNDLDKIKVHGLPKLVEEGMQFPFIGISPQAKQYGWKPETVKGLADDAVAKYRVDTDRIYLTGLSMGGFGTWATAMEFPEFFAAIVPICGGGDPGRAHALMNTPIWNFHGDADNVVPIERSDVIVEAVREYNPSIKYTIYPGVEHNSWERTYKNPEVWQWMLSQRKFRYVEAELSPAQLEEYTGAYLFVNDEGEAEDDQENTMTVESGKNSIVYTIGTYSETYYAAGNDIFFEDADTFDHMKFERDATGNIYGISVYYPQGITKLRKK